MNPALIAVNRAAGLAILEDGSALPINAFYDDDGEPTTDRGDACCAVVVLPEDRLLVIRLNYWPERVLH